MFGQNPVLKREDHDGSALRVVSIWQTIQGEGPFTGRPAVFVRLHGCHLRCYFCDTQFSNEKDPVVPIGDIVGDTIRLAPKGFGLRAGATPLVVLTGGEPTRQPLGPLVAALIDSGAEVQIETAGSFWQECLADCRIVVSPKTAFVHPEIDRHAMAWKYVIADSERQPKDPTDGLPIASTQRRGDMHRIARPKKIVPVYLSPMDEYDPILNAQNKQEVLDLALEHGYIASVQLHKVLGAE